MRLFDENTIKAHGAAALLGAYTTSQLHFVDLSDALDPRDSNHSFRSDYQYQASTSTSAFRLPSDAVLICNTKDLRAAGRVCWPWRTHRKLGMRQVKLSEPVQRIKDIFITHIFSCGIFKGGCRLSLLGVNDTSALQECTKILPLATTTQSVSKVSRIPIKILSVSGPIPSAASRGRFLLSRPLPLLGIST
jgi:hypothetical protein